MSTVEITNTSDRKLVFCDSFVLSPGQSRVPTGPEIKKMNQGVIDAWVEDGKVTVDGKKEAAAAKKAEEEAAAAKKAEEEAAAAKKAEEEAAAAKKAESKKTPAAKMPS